MLASADSSSPFDLAFGLPLHPLAVHVPVVLLPLGAVGVLLVLLIPSRRAQLAWPVIAVLAIATVGALVAKLSGEALAQRVGSPGQHEQLGNWVLAMATILTGCTLAWWLWERRAIRRRRPTGVMGLLAGTVLAAIAIGSIIVAVLTGHTGATRVWEGRIAAPAASASPSADPAATTGAGIAISDVAQHDDSASCWVAIDGTVYDVTGWIPLHPDGPDRLLAICGTDASAEYAEPELSQALPIERLQDFELGPLAER